MPSEEDPPLTLCPYCAEPLAGDSSDEHALPQWMFGNIEGSSPFLIQAHEKCNNMMGLTADAEPARSWIGMMSRAIVAWSGGEPGDGQARPLGVLAPEAFEGPDGRIGDVWVGPPGWVIVHFHEPYPEDDKRIYGPPVDKPSEEYDSGFVLVFVTDTDEANRSPEVIASIDDRFEGSTIYLGNIAQEQNPEFPEIPEELQVTLDNVREGLPEVDGNISVYLEDTNRLIAKLALALGASRWGDEFVESEDAQRLRDYAWEMDPQKRDNLDAEVQGIYEGRQGGISDLFGLDHAHVIILTRVNGDLVLKVIMFGDQEALCVIPEEEREWGQNIHPEGEAIIVSLLERACVGPITLPELIAWANGSYPQNELDELFGERSAGPEVP